MLQTRRLARSSIGRAPDCCSGGSGFEAWRASQMPRRPNGRTRGPEPRDPGSNPGGATRQRGGRGLTEGPPATNRGGGGSNPPGRARDACGMEQWPLACLIRRKRWVRFPLPQPERTRPSSSGPRIPPSEGGDGGSTPPGLANAVGRVAEPGRLHRFREPAVRSGPLGSNPSPSARDGRGAPAAPPKETVAKWEGARLWPGQVSVRFRPVSPETGS